jgi:hypothetical protein
MLNLDMEIKLWFSTYQLPRITKMKKFEIIDLIDELGFSSLATSLELNEVNYSQSLKHIHHCKFCCTEEEFPCSVYDEMIALLDLYYSL